ncbi:Rho termination factor N-terminal domain-containing protein [Microcoleus sp. FACHB-672]|uniref:Rho termination factor N-terminal domain-containing protein n=1 Tax=Microcoleus sp. FACHB-672 TaxID=2692825 RepID=UPI00168310E7|nr:Rho termination factor N-terminal domain-containing protein [Microcoleus sp. FACHB-672]MBD2039825.1 Rho termination factor N-terminal domain-containing protein [Microcoleus sp. FACHB-672]
MKLSTSLVAVKKITSKAPNSNFLETDINQAAQLILKAGGLINPIIIRRTSITSYEVVDGHFEYYVAVKAREIDPLNGENIAAYIIEPDNEEVLLSQIKALRRREGDNLREETIQPAPSSSIESQPLQPSSSPENQDIKNLVQQLEQSLAAILSSKIEESVKTLEANLKSELLEAIRNEISQQKLQTTTKTTASNYGTMKVAQLKEVARELNIPGRAGMKKEQLIAAINKAESS